MDAHQDSRTAAPERLDVASITSSDVRGVRWGRRFRGAVVVVLAATLLGACGVRMESPSPTQPVPDAAEASRRAAVQDVVDVARQARATQGTLPSEAGREEQAAVSAQLASLEAVVSDADAHLAALGGQYVSGLLDADGVPLPAEPTPADPAPGTQQTIDRLVQAYARTRGSLATQEDDAVARLLASIAVAQLTRAQALAAASGGEVPATEAPASAQVPAELPEGFDLDVTALIEAEDATGYAFEVLAARLTDAQRVAARTRAAEHRERAEHWARLTEVAGPAQDPRQIAYEVPAGLLAEPADTTAAHGLESALATSYATLVAEGGVDLRTAMLDLFSDSYGAALTWGAPPTPFPGLPEQSAP